LSKSIAAAPRAAATVVQLLRATEGLPPDRALPLESFAFAMLQGGAEHAAWSARQTSAAPLPPGTLHLRREGATLHLLLDRPAARNSIDRAMRDALFEAFTLATLDTGITCVKLRSTGRSFSMGADLAEFGTTRDPVAAHAIRARTLPAHQMVQRPEIYDIHIQGGCVGSGLELAAFAGRLTAAPDAWFHLPETGMGILPGFGGCVSIPRRIGRQRAAALMLSGKRINAKLALEWGLIDAIVNEPPADGVPF
jgi:enoyl-CoA hydratase/carnithine racemase